MTHYYSGARRGKGRGIRAKREKRARGKGRGIRENREGGGGACSWPIVFSITPPNYMQVQDICKTPGCQITSNENLANFSREVLDARIAFSYFLHANQKWEKQNRMADLTGVVKAKNAKVHLTTCDKPVWGLCFRHYGERSCLWSFCCLICYCLLARSEWIECNDRFE